MVQFHPWARTINNQHKGLNMDMKEFLDSTDTVVAEMASTFGPELFIESNEKTYIDMSVINGVVKASTLAAAFEQNSDPQLWKLLYLLLGLGYAAKGMSLEEAHKSIYGFGPEEGS